VHVRTEQCACCQGAGPDGEILQRRDRASGTLQVKRKSKLVKWYRSNFAKPVDLLEEDSATIVLSKTELQDVGRQR